MSSNAIFPSRAMTLPDFVTTNGLISIRSVSRSLAEAGQSRDELDEVGMRLAFEAEPPPELVGLEGRQSDRRIDRLADDPLGGLLGDLLDVHAALGRSHYDVAGFGPVEQNGQVELAGDVDALLDVETVDLLAGRTGLDGHQGRAQHLLGEIADGRFGGARRRP